MKLKPIALLLALCGTIALSAQTKAHLHLTNGVQESWCLESIDSITYLQPSAEVTLPISCALQEGGKMSFTYTVSDNQKDEPIKWASTDGRIAYVFRDSLYAKKMGKCIVSATYKGVTSYCVVQVSPYSQENTCGPTAQEKVYVHHSDGSILALGIEQLDSLRLVDQDRDLVIAISSDVIRVGDTLELSTNVLEDSRMDVAWTTDNPNVLRINAEYVGNKTEGIITGLQPGNVMLKAALDGLVDVKPITVIGKATSTGAPIVYWDVKKTYAYAEEKIPFNAQYDSKNSPVDYTAVWTDIVAHSELTATCALLKSVSHTYSKQAIRELLPQMQIKKIEHQSELWSDSAQAYVYSDQFAISIPDTFDLTVKDLKNPADSLVLLNAVKVLFDGDFAQEFKDGLTAKLNPTAEDRHYDGYMEAFRKLSLMDYYTTANQRDTMHYLDWITDSTYDVNTCLWKLHFKQYDSVFSTTMFDTLILRVDTIWNTKYNRKTKTYDTLWTVEWNPVTQKYDSIGWKSLDSIINIQPLLERIDYVYPVIKEQIDRVWQDSVSFLDLLLGDRGYLAEGSQKYVANTQLRVVDKDGNVASTDVHAIGLEKCAEKYIMTADSNPIVAGETTVTLQVGSYFTIREGEKQYKWILPDGTIDANTKQPVTHCDQATTPALIFNAVGDTQVELYVTINGVLYAKEIVPLRVGYSEAVPTLYYAEQGGNIRAYKLINNLPAVMENRPYDLGLRTDHAFNILFHDSLLYVLDAGKQFGYINDVESELGDGKIYVLSKDGSTVETMITNEGQYAFNDPYYGYVEKGFIYYSNRNTGIVRLPLDLRNATYDQEVYPWYVQNATLGYYNNGWAYGAIGGVFGKINSVWHWCKFYNGNGIFRFRDSDILPEPVTPWASENVPPQDGILIESMQPKSFVYTSKSAVPKFCFHILDAAYNGFYACSYEDMERIGSSKSELQNYAVKYNGMTFESNTTGNLLTVEGSNNEPVGICQMVYDEVNDCVYFAYRNNSNYAQNNPPTGIYRYHVATGVVDCLIEGVSAYGITINNQPSKLF